MPLQPVEGNVPVEAGTAAGVGRMSNAYLHCWKKYPKMKLNKSEKFLEAEKRREIKESKAAGHAASACGGRALAPRRSRNRRLGGADVKFFKITTLFVLVFSVFAQGCGDTERLSGIIEKASISGTPISPHTQNVFLDLTIKDKEGGQSILVKVPFKFNVQIIKTKGMLFIFDAVQEQFAGKPVVCSVSGAEIVRFKNSEITSVSGQCAQNGTDIEKWLIQKKLAVSR